MADASLTTATFNKALKTVWPQKRLTKLLLEKNATAAMIPIRPFKGLIMPLVVQYGIQTGRSAVFGTALANGTGSKQAQFVMSTAKDYASGGIEGEALFAIEDDESLIAKLEEEMQGSFDSLDESIGEHIHGDGAGNLGRIASLAAGPPTTFTLTNPYDAVRFFVGMVLQANPNRTGNSGTLRAGTGTITAVDHDNGVITYTANGGFTPVVNDYVYVEGDYDAKMKGFEGWNPETAPTSGDSFLTVDRSVHIGQLAGHRYDASAFNPIEGINKALAHARALKCLPTVLCVNPLDAHNIRQDLGNAVVWDIVKSPNDPSVSIQTVKFSQGGRMLRMYEDEKAPRGVVRGFDPANIAIYARNSMFPGVLDKDGNKIRADASADAYKWRLGFYAQIGCQRPKDLLRIKIAT
jgi:hypothetical protein